MQTRTPMSDLLDECIISHSYVEDSSVVITLQLVRYGRHVANIEYCPATVHAKIYLIDTSSSQFVLQCFDLALSWMKAYAMGLDNNQLEYLPAGYMVNA